MTTPAPQVFQPACLDNAKADRGAALILALLTSGLLAALGISLLLVADVERRVAANAGSAIESLEAAEAILERAIVDVRASTDWSRILAGTAGSTFADATRRPRLPWGVTLDLDGVTVELQGEMNTASGAGADTPRWRLFAWGPLAALAGAAVDSQIYAAAWVADDAADGDGDPLADGNGRLQLHAEARGPGGARRGVEALVERTSEGGVRMGVWREVR